MDSTRVSANSTTDQPSHRSTRQPKAYSTEQNLPTPEVPAAEVTNASVNNTHSPFPQQSCSLPTRHLGSEQAAEHQPKNHCQAPKGQELLQTADPLRMAVGRTVRPPTKAK